jgi:AbrB family looped-hinge helix DNA binding protein
MAGGEMPSETTVDRFGRVVIPKQTRDRFGLGPGASLSVREQEDGILLRPGTGGEPVRRVGHVLVFAGQLAGDTARAVQRVREERVRRLQRSATR